jgi:hypothetical protein
LLLWRSGGNLKSAARIFGGTAGFGIHHHCGFFCAMVAVVHRVIVLKQLCFAHAWCVNQATLQQMGEDGNAITNFPC